MNDYERCQYEVEKLRGMAGAMQNTRGMGNTVGMAPSTGIEQRNERRCNWTLRLRVHELIRAAKMWRDAGAESEG